MFGWLLVDELGSSLHGTASPSAIMLFWCATCQTRQPAYSCCKLCLALRRINWGWRSSLLMTYLLSIYWLVRFTRDLVENHIKWVSIYTTTATNANSRLPSQMPALKKKIVPFYKSAKLNKLNAPHYLQLAQLQYATNMCCPPKKQHCSWLGAAYTTLHPCTSRTITQF